MSKMIAYCGLVCSHCPTFLATWNDDDDARKKTARLHAEKFGLDVKSEDINCDGCKTEGGKRIGYCVSCAVRRCCGEKGLENCLFCIYQQFIDWFKAWWGLPDSEHLMPTIQSFYTPEEVALLTGIPFSGRSLEALAEMKGMTPEALAPRLDALAHKADSWRSQRGQSIRYSFFPNTGRIF